jgi:F0F1-type ATP synthase membrane subunit b/b'
MGEWRRLMRAHRNGGTVALGIVRDKREQTVSMTLPQRKPREESSLELPDFEHEMEQLRIELQKMQPTIQKAVRVAQVKLTRDLKEGVQKAREEIQQQMKEAEKEIEKATREMERDLEKP